MCGLPVTTDHDAQVYKTVEVTARFAPTYAVIDVFVGLMHNFCSNILNGTGL